MEIRLLMEPVIFRAGPLEVAVREDVPMVTKRMDSPIDVSDN